ncbi:MAG: hypothetical protein ABL977_14385, partial [Candidatus Eisenbacteria bacterium]
MSHDRTPHTGSESVPASRAGTAAAPLITRPATPRPHPPTLIAMGGNSLLDPSQPPTVANQFAVT